MKNLIILLSITCFALQLSFAQNLSLSYRLCTGCSILEGIDNSSGTYQYGAEQDFESRDVTSDYGCRQLPSSPWHKGVDYKPYQYAGFYAGGRGTAILAAADGIVARIQGSNFKYIALRHNVIVPYLHGNGFGYAHIFSDGHCPSVMQSGKFVLKLMDPPNECLYAIIDTEEGRAIGAPMMDVQDATVTYNNITYDLEHEVDAGQDIAPMGDSGGNYPVHLHLDLFREIGLDGAIDYADRTNRYDPLSLVEHDEPDYSVKIKSENQADFGQISLLYPGSSPSKFLIRGEMENATIPPNGQPVPGGGSNRYDNVVLNIDDVEVQLSNASTGDWATVQGPSFEAKISHGGREASSVYPMSNGTNVTASLGNWNTQGIYPSAYSDFNGHPYDEFYFTDFYTRIHKDDPQSGAGQIKIANCPDNARYQDGVYDFRAKVTDVKGHEHFSEEVAVKLDNFQPYIRSVELSSPNGPLQYAREWECGSCGISLSAIPDLEVSKSEWVEWLSLEPQLILEVEASEPLEQLTMDIVGENGPIAEDIAGVEYPGGVRWVFGIGSYANQLNGKVDFIFYGYDTNENELLALSSEQQGSCIKVPTREGADNWDNPDAIQSGPDAVHSICVDCGGRSVGAGCANILLIEDAMDCLEVEADINNASSANASNGSINLSITGGVGPYTFEWSNGATTQNISGLPPGTYTVVISDAFCCVVEASYTISGCPDVSTVYISGEVADASNGNNGSIDITLYAISTGAPIAGSNFQYSWSSPLGYTASSEDITGLSPSVYCVTVTERRTGCLVGTRCFSVCSPLISTIEDYGGIECEGETGTLEVQLYESNITPPYTIEWSNGANTTMNEHIHPGMYCVTVTDANGCTEKECLEVKVQYPIDLALEIESSVCMENDGSISLSASSEGSQITSYVWSNGETTPGIENLPPGEYCVTVTNDKGCEKTECSTVESVEISIGIDEIVNPSFCSQPPCSESGANACTADGSIAVSVNTTEPSLTYEWSGPNGYVASTEDISGLLPGVYVLTVKSTDCIAQKEIKLRACYEEEYVEWPGEPGGCEYFSNSFNFSAPDGNVTPVDYNCNGSIELDYSSTTSLYYSWTGPGNFISSEKSIFNLCEGTYCVTVSNGCGLEKSACFEVVDCNTQNLAATADVMNDCSGYDVGGITLNVSGGSPPYEYSWSNGSSGPALENVSSGHYCVTVTDQNGCSVVDCNVVGNQSTTSEWIGCTNAVLCGEEVVSVTEYPVVELPDPTNCRNVVVICQETGELLHVYTPDPIFDILGDCSVAEINPVTGQVCQVHYGMQHQEVISSCVQPNPEICPFEVYCDLVTYCVFPTLNNNYYVENVENWLQVGIVGVPPYCFKQYYCRFASDPMCQCPAPCGALEAPVDIEIAAEMEKNQLYSLESALENVNLKDPKVLEEYYFKVDQRLKKINSSLNDLIINPDFTIVDSAMAAVPPVLPTGKIENRETRFEIYPNPVYSIINIEATLQEPMEDLKMAILDITGKEVYQQPLSAQSGQNKWVVDNVSNLPDGLYLIQITLQDRFLFSQKIIIQH